MGWQSLDITSMNHYNKVCSQKYVPIFANGPTEVRMRDVNTITQNYKSIGLQLQGDTTFYTQCFKLKGIYFGIF